MKKENEFIAVLLESNKGTLPKMRAWHYCSIKNSNQRKV
jgi:hypothetical protein